MILPWYSNLQEMFSSFHGGGEFLVEPSRGTVFLCAFIPELRDYKIGLRP